MIYIQHQGKKVTGYSEIQHFDSDILVDENTIDLEKIGFYEVVNNKLVYNINLFNEQTQREQSFFRIAELKKLLEDSDYKVIKCYEATLTNEPLPYDYVALIRQRKAWREEIETLQQE